MKSISFIGGAPAGKGAVIFNSRINAGPVGFAIFLLALIMCIASTQVFADGAYEKHPILDRDPKTYESEAELSELSAEEIMALREAYEQALKDSQKDLPALAEAEETLLKRLFEYDDVRVDITHVIPMIVDDYDIDDSTSSRLEQFGERFQTVHGQRSSYVESLKDYRAYDFQQGMSYASMMAVFYDNQDLFDQLHNDMKDPDTSIGAYIDELKVSYKDVEKARQDLDRVMAAMEVEEVIQRIDAELESRK